MLRGEALAVISSLDFTPENYELAKKALAFRDKNLKGDNFIIKIAVGNSIFTNLKDPVFQLKQSNLVYKIDYLNCDITYVGQTKQYLRDRIKQQKTDFLTDSLTTKLLSDNIILIGTIFIFYVSRGTTTKD